MRNLTIFDEVGDLRGHNLVKPLHIRQTTNRSSGQLIRTAIYVTAIFLERSLLPLFLVHLER